MADTTDTAVRNRRLNLGVGLFITVYGAYHLLNGYAGDNFNATGFLLMGLGLLVGYAAENTVDARVGPKVLLASRVVLVIGIAIATVDLLGLAP